MNSSNYSLEEIKKLHAQRDGEALTEWVRSVLCEKEYTEGAIEKIAFWFQDVPERNEGIQGDLEDQEDLEDRQADHMADAEEFWVEALERSETLKELRNQVIKKTEKILESKSTGGGNHKEHSYEDLKGFSDNKEFEKLAEWAGSVLAKNRYSLGELYRFYAGGKSSGPEGRQDIHSEQDAVSEITSWFVGTERKLKKIKDGWQIIEEPEEEWKTRQVEHMQGVGKFWEQAFKLSDNLGQLETRVKVRGKVTLRVLSQKGDMHEKTKEWLHRACREEMQEADATFKREAMGRSQYGKDVDYYGFESWPPAAEQGFLNTIREDLPELPKRKIPHVNVVDTGPKTTPFEKEDIRWACLQALEHINKYAQVGTLLDTMLKNGWFQFDEHHEYAFEDLSASGANKGGGGDDGREDCYDHPDEYKRPKIDPDDPAIPKLRTHLKGLDSGASIVLVERVIPKALELPYPTFDQLAKDHGKSLQHYKNRQDELFKGFQKFLDSLVTEIKSDAEEKRKLHDPTGEKLAMIRFLLDLYKNGDPGLLLINEEQIEPTEEIE